LTEITEKFQDVARSKRLMIAVSGIPGSGRTHGIVSFSYITDTP